jgi:hypothetical protein
MKTDANKSFLDQIEIASPCTVSWETMNGDDLVRHCSQCSLSVYNISEMSKSEAETLVRVKEGRLCIRMYKRFDGTVITNDCPVGLRKLKQSLQLISRAAAALLTFLLSLVAANGEETKSSNTNSPTKQPATNAKCPVVLQGEPITLQGAPVVSQGQRGVLQGKPQIHHVMGKYSGPPPKPTATNKPSENPTNNENSQSANP